jgi:protein phosphatase
LDSRVAKLSKLISAGKTDPGLKRPKNEDVFIESSDLGIYGVADGMGGAAAGELASKFFAETVLDVFTQKNDDTYQTISGLVLDAFAKANQRIRKHIKKNPAHNGMGCTAELIAFYNKGYILGHVGDSRTYIYRKGKLKQLTRDHSLIQEQIDQGLFTPIEAKQKPFKNVILRAIGVDDVIKVDLSNGETMPGDIFLLCSDGLTDMIDDDVIAEVLSSPAKLSTKVEGLIELAKLVGGVDNITSVLAQIS